MSNYLQAKILVDFGGGFTREYFLENVGDTIDEFKKTVNDFIKDLPKTYIKFGDIKYKFKRKYPNFKDNKNLWFDVF